MSVAFRRWSPGNLDPVITLNAHIILFLAALVRGVDYASGESASSARRLGAIELAAPLWLWGALFMASAVVGFIGMAVRSVDAVILGHSLGTALYVTLAVGIGWDTWQRVDESSYAVWWVAALMGLLVAVVWAAASIRDVVSVWVAGGATLAAGLALASVPLDALRNATVLLAIAGLHGFMAAGNAMRWSQDEEIKRRVDNGEL